VLVERSSRERCARVGERGLVAIRNLVEQGLVEQGLVEQGLVEQGLVEQGLVDQDEVAGGHGVGEPHSVFRLIEHVAITGHPGGIDGEDDRRTTPRADAYRG
jgi:GLTT repeat-containing protein